MDKAISLLGTCVLLCFAFSGVLHAEEDAEGCKDSDLVTRMPGSTLSYCEHKEFDQHEVQLKGSDGERASKNLEGEVWYWQYRPREGVTPLQMFRNVQNAVQSGGFKVVYSASADVITAQKADTWLHFEFYDNSYNQYVVKVKEMGQEVSADASKLQSELDSSGHVAVYGIHFDTGKAAILPDSEPVLKEIKKLLDGNTDLKLLVEGHTDNQGTEASNQTLSEKRAEAVINWLATNGVDASRLSAKGFGETKPVAENSTEEGRAKNRRVELVKRVS